MSWRSHVIDARRLLFWRAPRFNDQALSPSQVLLIFAFVAILNVTDQFIHSSGLHVFSMYGLNAVIAFEAGVLAIILFFAGRDRSITLRNLVLVSAVSAMLGLLASEAMSALQKLPQLQALDGAVEIAIFALIGLGLLIWMAGAARQAFNEACGVERPILRALAFSASILLAAIAFPHWPVFPPDGFERSTANAWEVAQAIWDARSSEQTGKVYAAEARKAEARAAKIEGDQPVRLDAALASVEPRATDRSNIFLVGLAGWGAQDVFESETHQSIDILKARFDIGNRAVELVNSDQTVDRFPIASIQNLSAVLRRLGARMDREKDVLILTMTSHGSRDGFALSFDHLVYRALDPSTLKKLLDEAGIKNRILIVAACYSGVFVPVLANDDTMIMTAASATRTSFGCASGREWTYFGDAFFDHGLKKEHTLAAAFSTARDTVGRWEREQHLTPSDPQLYVGRDIARRFPKLVGKVSASDQPKETALETRSGKSSLD